MTAGIARPALTVFAIAAAARLGAWGVFPLPEPNYHYWLARGLLDLDAFALGPDPTSFIEPLYPAFLAACMTIRRRRPSDPVRASADRGNRRTGDVLAGLAACRQPRGGPLRVAALRD